jgi:hypothetical protein
VRTYQLVVKALAILGLLFLGMEASTALKKHYTVTCVDNDADNYGFTVPQIKAGVQNSPAVYERYL